MARLEGEHETLPGEALDPIGRVIPENSGSFSRVDNPCCMGPFRINKADLPYFEELAYNLSKIPKH